MSTSIDDLDIEDNLKIYPNPTDEAFYIKYDRDGFSEKLVTIFSLDGVIVYQKNVVGKTIVHTADWVAGTYLVRTEGAIMKLIVY